MTEGFLEHADLVTTNLHVATYTVADAAARIALATTLTADQVGLFVYQEDTDHLYVCDAITSLVDLGTLITLDDHLHVGVAGDGGQLEADEALLATDITEGYVPTADGADAVAWQPVSYEIVCFNNEVVVFDDEVVTLH